LTGFATRGSSQRRMRLKRSSKSSRLLTTCIATMSSTGVSYCGPRSSIPNLTRPTDLKPENLLYRTRDPDSDLVLADFGIAKMLDRQDEVLTTMAGSFGYAAPEVMLKQGHGKAVDMWSMGVITYTLLCGYSPFRSETLQELIEECSKTEVVFHKQYWKDVSDDAKAFILGLLQPRPQDRWTSQVSCSTASHYLTSPNHGI
jgi:serine/threonine protein kinase